MVMLAGTVAAGDELDKLTWIPPVGASPSQNPAKQPTSRSTMPSMSAPPVAMVGNNWNGVSFSFGGRIVNVVETDVPLNDAVTVTGCRRRDEADTHRPDRVVDPSGCNEYVDRRAARRDDPRRGQLR
jgi:hypothetical protein